MSRRSSIPASLHPTPSRTALDFETDRRRREDPARRRIESEGRMKDWVKRHPLASYFFVAYAVSWSIAVPLALQAQGILPERLPWSLHYLTAFGPAAAALLIARLLREPAGTTERAEPRSVARGIFWWTVGFGSPLLLFVIALVAARIAGRTGPPWTSLGQVNFLPDLGLAAWGLWFVTSGVGEGRSLAGATGRVEQRLPVRLAHA